MHIEIQNCFSFWGTSSPNPYRGFAPGPNWGTSVPQTPCTGRPHILYQVYAHGCNLYQEIFNTAIDRWCKGLLEYFGAEGTHSLQA